MHDVVFHTIFGSDLYCTLEFVHASAVLLHSITQCKFLVGMMNAVVSQMNARSRHPPCASSHEGLAACGPDVIKALFFLFMNIDMVLKEYVCDPGVYCTLSCM